MHFCTLAANFGWLQAKYANGRIRIPSFLSVGAKLIGILCRGQCLPTRAAFIFSLDYRRFCDIVWSGLSSLIDGRLGRRQMLEMLLLALIAIGVFAGVWELEQIRQILNKRP
jgi:hypothetical protein